MLKHAGDAFGAAVQMEEARRLDGQDRFLNSKAGKYWLRAGQEDRALSILGLFTKVSRPLQSLKEVLKRFWLLERGTDLLSSTRAERRPFPFG